MIFFLRALVFSLFVVSCSNNERPFSTIVVSETNGLERDLEYVTVQIPDIGILQDNQILVAKDLETGKSVPVQIMDTLQENHSSLLRILFPVTIPQNSSKAFDIHIGVDTDDVKLSRMVLAGDNFSVENEIYKATFSNEDDPRGGQVNGLVLKNFNDQRLRRSHIAMHWAPNFSKEGEDGYYNMENLNASSKNEIDQGYYAITKRRKGITDSVPEIVTEGKYTFLADSPYFIFESNMRMIEDVTLKLLRNDEMTMDSLFTHVAYQKTNGTTTRLKLYDAELDSLDRNPISDNSGFVAFYNTDYGYGFASIRLKYDNTDSKGIASPLVNQHTKISKARNNGRYWNRVLLDSVTAVPKGSMYYEKNAYLIFDVSPDVPEENILYHAERLWNPLNITLQNN